MEKRQVTITNAQGVPSLYASKTENGDLYLSFEVFGGKGQFDVESIYTIPQSEFSKIESIFDLPTGLDILDQVQIISDRGEGSTFEKAVNDKVFEVETFVWWSDND